MYYSIIKNITRGNIFAYNGLVNHILHVSEKIHVENIVKMMHNIQLAQAKRPYWPNYKG